MLLEDQALKGGVGTQDWEGPGRQQGGQGRGKWAVDMEGLGAEGRRRGEEGRGGGLNPGRETSHHPPEGPEVEQDVDWRKEGISKPTQNGNRQSWMRRGS